MLPDPLPRSEHDPMGEGEEPPPPGIKLMAMVRWAFLGAAVLLAGFAWWSYAGTKLRGSSATSSARPIYHCPMHPQIVSNQPGECPICHMNLEPISSMRSGGTRPSLPAPGTAPPGTVSITLAMDRIQSIGVRTAVAGENGVDQKLRVTAVVAPAEQGVAEVHVRTPGFVEQVRVSQTGVAVAARQPLFTFYSPEIFQAESELVAAEKWETGDASAGFAGASRSKLELLGMSGRDIDEVLRTRRPLRAVPVYAPQAGYVTKKNLVTGAYVTPDMVLYEILDLANVYVIADVFQRDVGFLAKGTAGRFTPTQRPDQTTEVRVDLIYPSLAAEARTTRVRMQVQNPRGIAFRLGEYGTVEFSTPIRRALTVPRDAVIDTGLYQYVFVVEGEGRFTPRSVQLGAEEADRITIEAGLAPGERVVSGATFLIDSESRLQASAVQASETPMAP